MIMIVVALFIGCVALFDTTAILPIDECQTTMSEHGLTARFPGVVAHGIHSLTLEDIRYYFKSDADENNGIPTINYDLSSSEQVLPNAPLYGFDTSFTTSSMRHLDQVLRDMDKENWYLTNYDTLEKLAHTFHMGEVWENTRAHLNSIIRLQPGAELCGCVKDVNKNGVIQMLYFMALKIKYPGITSGIKLLLNNDGVVDWDGNLYKYRFINQMTENLHDFDFGADENHVIQRASEDLVDGDGGMKARLTSEGGWKTWKDDMKEMVEHDNYELATFMYCTLYM